MSEWTYIRDAVLEMASNKSISNDTVISNPFSDDRVAATSRTSPGMASASDSTEDTVIITSRSSQDTVIITRRSIEVLEITVPFKHVDSLDLPKKKFEKLQNKARKLCKRVFSTKRPQRPVLSRPKFDFNFDSSRLKEAQEKVLSEAVRIARRFGQEVIYHIEYKNAVRYGYLCEIECQRAERRERLERDLAQRREKFQVKRTVRQQEKKYVRFA